MEKPLVSFQIEIKCYGVVGYFLATVDSFAGTTGGCLGEVILDRCSFILIQTCSFTCIVEHEKYIMLRLS